MDTRSCFWILHVLRDRRGIGVTLTELPPGGSEEVAALLVLKHHMKLVDKHMGALASLPVEGDAVEHGVGNDQQAGGLKLFAQVVDIRSPISISGKSIGEVDKIVQFANGQIYPINAKRPQEFAASQGLLGIQMCD